MKKFRFFSILTTFAFCYLCWIAFTLDLSSQELILGAIISLLVAIFSSRFLIHEKPLFFLKPKRIFYLLKYCLYDFIKELWRGNVEVAKRALSPRLNINPGIVKIQTELKSEYGLSFLANSITLRPGTVTMEIVEENGKNYFYIHWLNVSVTKGKEAGEAIKGTLEKSARRVFN